MTWFYVDDSFHTHPKALAAGNAACGLWTRCGSWVAANLTDGFIPEAVVRRLGTRLQANRLVRVGLWEQVEGGWRMHSKLSATPGAPELTVWCLVRDDHRHKIPSDLRARVYERDGWRCVRCAAVDDLSLDHIYPWSLGGRDVEENLRTLCRSCNSKKGAKVE